MGMAPRAGKRAYVDESPDVKLLKQARELLRRPVTVSDRINHERTVTSMPAAIARSSAALAWLAAISTSPMLFSYQNSSPRGAAENTRACPTRRSDTPIAVAGSMADARNPVIALP